VSVPTGDAQATFAATLVDEWVRAGVRHAVVCPGSRSTPLVVALAERDEIVLHVRLDERGACFFAVGLALATDVPTVVCTTSGTAAAELHPGVVEASHARVPLIVCTADRPARLHHVGAPQTIEQAHLFGAAVRSSFEPGLARDADRSWWRSLGARVVAEAVAAAGPVHLNLAFEEPLLGAPGPLPPGRADGAPWPAAPSARALGSGIGDIGEGRWRRRGLIIAGGGAPPAGPTLAAADHLGWPVLADPRSGIRVAHPAVVSAADAILRDPAVGDALAPETVLLLGDPWASRVLAEFVESAGHAGAEIVAVGGSLSDPGRVVHEFHRVDGSLFVDRLGSVRGSAPSGWRSSWERAEAAAQRAIDKVLDDDRLTAGGRATEPGVARHLFGCVHGATLFASSSMPVRDLEWYGAPRANPPRVMSNRGANGIDGVTSSALGVSAGGDQPVVAVLGDLAFLHDASALAALGTDAGSCTLVVLDNGGGGIFSFLAQASLLEHERFERLFGTAPRVSIAEVGRGFGLPVADVSTLAALDDALARFVGHEPRSLIRVVLPSREENVALHDRIHAAVGGAVRATLAD
jgi:2-succinyl-5-enolpyruvyl-6-hydroxy-3-cyclohexene-1-carboxylate synthase